MNTKKIFKTCLLINLAFAGLAHANENKPYCKIDEVPYKKQVRVNDLPSYFFKVHPSGEFIGYIGVEGNQLLNLKNGERYPLPGFIDPAFTPDGKHLIVPIPKEQLKGRLTHESLDALQAEDNDGQNNNTTMLGFYEFDKFKMAALTKDQSKKTLDSLHGKPISVDEGAIGVYQSASFAKDGSFKLITDQSGASLATYKRDSAGVKLEGAIETVCNKNANFKTDLPMLSKDGRFVSTYNSETKTTQIFQLKEDGNCSLALDLGMATGKVSFNRDSSQITFHVDRFSEGFGSYFSGVASDINKEVYVLNLDLNEDADHNITLKPTTWAKASNSNKKGDGSYYSDFSDKGDVFFLSDENNYFEFVQVEQKNLNFVPYISAHGKDVGKKLDQDLIYCTQVNPPAQPLYILGQLWSNTCEQIGNPRISETMMNTMKLNAKNCEDLVRNEWNENFIQKMRSQKFNEDFLSLASSLKVEDLLAVCPTNAPKDSKKNIVGFWQKRDNQKLKDVIKQKCLACHTREIEYQKEKVVRAYYDENMKTIKTDKEKKTFKMPAIDLEKMDYEMAAKFSAAIANPDPKYKMPKTGTLTAEEKVMFNTFLQEKQLDLPSNYTPPGGRSYQMIPLYSEQGLQDYFEKNYITVNTNFLNSITDEKVKNDILAGWKREVWCQMGRVACQELIADKLEEKKKELQIAINQLNPDQQKKKLQEYELGLKCRFQHETTLEMCEGVAFQY